MIVVEPVLTEEKLKHLLSEAHEQTELDFKSQLDLSNRGEVIELTKDIAAMQSNPRGGYIVVGCDDHGQVLTVFTDQAAKLFDEAALRTKVNRYIAEPFELRTARFKMDGKNVVLIYVGTNASGWAVFVCPGEYDKKLVFRVGDVFVRHGSASERWVQTDVERLLTQVIEKRKDQWRAEMLKEYDAAYSQSSPVKMLNNLSADSLSLELDDDTFATKVDRL